MLREEVNELKNVVIKLATLQKKQNKAQKQSNKPSGGTKIVVLPNNSTPQTKSTINDNLMDVLRKSIM